MYSAAERFLLDFHQARPGVTEEAFGELAVRRGGRDLRSSYAALAEAVPAHARRVLDLACGSAPLQARRWADREGRLTLPLRLRRLRCTRR